MKYRHYPVKINKFQKTCLNFGSAGACNFNKASPRSDETPGNKMSSSDFQMKNLLVNYESNCYFCVKMCIYFLGMI